MLMIRLSKSAGSFSSATGGRFQERSCILSRKFPLTLAVLLLAFSAVSMAQTLTTLVHQPPNGIQITFQLTDGTVMAQGNASSDWYKLTPDITGSYVKGTWTKLASLPAGYVPSDFASAVLADGRLAITGGEYNNNQFTLTNLGAVYDPVANTWTNLPPPVFEELSNRKLRKSILIVDRIL